MDMLWHKTKKSESRGLNPYSRTQFIQNFPVYYIIGITSPLTRHPPHTSLHGSIFYMLKWIIRYLSWIHFKSHNFNILICSTLNQHFCLSNHKITLIFRAFTKLILSWNCNAENWKKPYFKLFLYPYFCTLVNNTTVSTWKDSSLWITDFCLSTREHIHEPFNDRSVLSLKSVCLKYLYRKGIRIYFSDFFCLRIVWYFSSLNLSINSSLSS